MIDLYVNYSDKSPNFNTVGEAINYASQKYTSCEPQFPAPNEDAEPVTIHIASGVYRERVVIERPYITLKGESAGNTIIVSNKGARDLMNDGSKRGTFRTATVRISTHDVHCENITFQNDAGHRYKAGQAIALYNDGDRNSFKKCRFLGFADTLFTAPLPPKPMSDTKFNAPNEDKPRTLGRQYYEDCYIEGDIDFIFGGAIAYFKGCELFSLSLEEIQPDTKDGKTIYGYITAASTPENELFGYVFDQCRLTGNCPDGTVMLGRPWRDHAKTVFLNCYLGKHISSDGWADWDKNTDTLLYAEYNSYGPGASNDDRVSYSRQLNDEEAKEYTVEKVLQGWNSI